MSRTTLGRLLAFIALLVMTGWILLNVQKRYAVCQASCPGDWVRIEMASPESMFPKSQCVCIGDDGTLRLLP